MKLNYFIQGHQGRQDGENCLQMTIDCKQKVQILARCQRKALFAKRLRRSCRIIKSKYVYFVKEK